MTTTDATKSVDINHEIIQRVQSLRRGDRPEVYYYGRNLAHDCHQPGAEGERLTALRSAVWALHEADQINLVARVIDRVPSLFSGNLITVPVFQYEAHGRRSGSVESVPMPATTSERPVSGRPVSGNLSEKLREPVQWLGDARILLAECHTEIDNLREANREYQNKCADLEADVKRLKTKKKKAKAKEKAKKQIKAEASEIAEASEPPIEST